MLIDGKSSISKKLYELRPGDVFACNDERPMIVAVNDCRQAYIELGTGREYRLSDYAEVTHYPQARIVLE